MGPGDLGPLPDPPVARDEAVRRAADAWSAFEEYFVLSYRSSTGSPIRVSELNLRAAGRLGISPERAIDDPGGFARLVHPDDRDRVLAEHWDAVVRGQGISSEYRMLGSTGTVLWIHDMAAPITDVAGRTTLYGRCLDITPRPSPSGEPPADDDPMAWAVANMPCALYRCACDESGTIEYLSDQIEDIVGYPAADFVDNARRSYDSIIHPDDLAHVVAEVADALGRSAPYSLEYRVVRDDGETRWVAEHGRPVFGPDGVPRWTAGIIIDVSRQKATSKSRELFERQIRRQAHYDGLTGLPNRVLFRERLAQAISDIPDADGELAVLVINLERFKKLNDTLGREAGDAVLQEVGNRVQKVLRDGDIVARLGRDEFAVLVHGAGRAEALEVVHRIRDALSVPMEMGGLAVVPEASVGISRWPNDGMDADSLLQCADTASYVAKDDKLHYAFYDPSVDARAAQRLELIGELSGAVSEDALVVHYQPKVSLKDGRVGGIEALVRWQDPLRGLLLPDEFIPVARETSLIRRVTAAVLAQAARQWRAWAEGGWELPMAVNVTRTDLADPALPGEVAALLETYAMPAGMLQLELTESCVTDDPASTEDVIERLGAMGVRLSVDDFGTGQLPLPWLKRLPLAELKIDPSFVSNVLSRADDEAIVRATIDLAHDLGLDVVGEGVEKRAVLDRLSELGCDFAQGFHLSRPVPPEELAIWLDQQPDAADRVARRRKFREDPVSERRASA